jgi:hypothetical protein
MAIVWRLLDLSTRSGADLGGHGDVNFRGATVENHDLNADYRPVSRPGLLLLCGWFYFRALPRSPGTAGALRLRQGIASHRRSSMGMRVTRKKLLLMGGSAFDQTHTGTAQIFYHQRWHGFWTGSALRYGSATLIEHGARRPQHFTCDLASGIDLWNAAPAGVGI